MVDKSCVLSMLHQQVWERVWMEKEVGEREREGRKRRRRRRGRGERDKGEEEDGKGRGGEGEEEKKRDGRREGGRILIFIQLEDIHKGHGRLECCSFMVITQ